MRIFRAFLILVAATILLLLPVTTGIYDFRTDLREDQFYVTTAVGTTNSTVQLFDEIYDDDTSTISVSSNDITDTPYAASYNTTSRALLITGLTANSTRYISATYDVASFSQGSLSTFFDYLPVIWIVMMVALPIAGVTAIFIKGKS